VHQHDLYIVSLTTLNETGRRTRKEHEKGALVSFKHFVHDFSGGEQDVMEMGKAGVCAVHIANTGSCHCQFASNLVKCRTFKGEKMSDGPGLCRECLCEACLIRDCLYVKHILDIKLITREALLISETKI
jgi:hypothetical protein